MSIVSNGRGQLSVVQVPQRVIAARRAVRLVASRRGAATTFFSAVLAGYVAVSITKIHQALPLVGSLQPAKLLALLLLPAAFFALRWSEVSQVLRNRAAICAIAIGTLAVLSVPGALWKGYAVEFLLSEFWKTLLMSVIMAIGWLDRRTLHMSLVAVGVGGIVPAYMMVAHGAEGERARFGQAFDANEAALMFLVIIPIALHLAQRRGWQRFMWYGSVLLMVGAVVRTGSRGGFIGLIALGVFLVLTSPPGQRWRQILVICGGAIAFVLSLNEATWNRLRTVTSLTQDYNYDTEEGRIQVWKRGATYMLENPLLGVGVKNFPIAEGHLAGKVERGMSLRFTAAHNSFVEIGAELGLPGLIAFVAMLWTAAAGCRRVIRAVRGISRAQAPPPPELLAEAGVARAALISVSIFAVAGSFLSFAYHPITFFLVALSVACHAGFRIPPQLIPRQPAAAHPRSPS